MSVTEDERQLLKSIATRVDTMQGQMDKMERLYAAFLELPPGSPKDAKTLLEEVRALTGRFRQASWIVRVVVYTLTTLAAVKISIDQLGWFKK